MKLAQALTKEHLRMLDSLSINIQNKMHAGFTGARKSVLKGHSQEFSDFKNYMTGDDIKHIDWNSYARLDKLFIKLFMEEKQASVNIFLDTSKSMDNEDFKMSKAFYSKLMAASLSYLALKNTDNVSIFTYDTSFCLKKTKVSGMKMFIDIVEFLDSLEYKGKTSINACFKGSNTLNINRGLSIILSDFFSSDGLDDGVKALQYLKQDVFLIQILSPLEVNPNFLGDVRLIDSENGNALDISINREIIDGYAAALKNFRAGISSFCKKRGINYFFADTDLEIIKALNSIL